MSGVQSLDRAVAILRAFDLRRPQMGLSEIAEALELTVSTTHRLLQSLKAHGLVIQSDGSKAYAPGPALLDLAAVAQSALDVQEIARPILPRLRDRVGETVGLHVIRNDIYRVVVDQAESHHPLRRTYTGLGEPIPIHQGAPGKVLLAFLDADRREAVFQVPLEAATEGTIVDEDALRADLEEIRSRGYALSFGERVAGIHTVAVPIFDHNGRATASLSITGPAIRMPADRLERMVPAVTAAAFEISTHLGYVPPKEDDS